VADSSAARRRMCVATSAWVPTLCRSSPTTGTPASRSSATQALSSSLAGRGRLQVDGVVADDVTLDHMEDVDRRGPRAGERHRHRAHLAGGRPAHRDDQRAAPHGDLVLLERRRGLGGDHGLLRNGDERGPVEPEHGRDHRPSRRQITATSAAVRRLGFLKTWGALFVALVAGFMRPPSSAAKTVRAVGARFAAYGHRYQSVVRSASR
jgi:hypothetical protein